MGGAVCRPPAAAAAPDGGRLPASPDPLPCPSIARGHPFDPGGQGTAGPPVNAHPQCHPAPRRCGEHLPQDQRNSRVDGRHASATLKDRMDQPREPSPQCVKKSLPRGSSLTAVRERLLDAHPGRQGSETQPKRRPGRSPLRAGGQSRSRGSMMAVSCCDASPSSPEAPRG